MYLNRNRRTSTAVAESFSTALIYDHYAIIGLRQQRPPDDVVLGFPLLSNRQPAIGILRRSLHGTDGLAISIVLLGEFLGPGNGVSDGRSRTTAQRGAQRHDSQNSHADCLPNPGGIQAQPEVEGKTTRESFPRRGIASLKIQQIRCSRLSHPSTASSPRKTAETVALHKCSRRPPGGGGLQDGSPVCLGVRRPANSCGRWAGPLGLGDTSYFEQTALIQRQAVTSRTQTREPCDSREPPALDSPQSPDSPAAFLDSRRGIRSIRYESDRSGASFSGSSAIDRPTFSAMLLGYR